MQVQMSNGESREALTARELFEWASANGLADVPLRYTNGGRWALLDTIDGLVEPAYMNTVLLGVDGHEV